MAEPDMVEVEVLDIEGSEYYVLHEIEHKGVTYLYLSGVDDADDIRIWKRQKDDPDFVGPLDSEAEVLMASFLFLGKGSESN